jgi:hypothetical protein
MPEKDAADRMLGRQCQIGRSSRDSLTLHNADGTNRVELELHQAAIRSQENGPAAVDREPRVWNFQGVAVGHFNDEWYKRLAMDQLDDGFFDLLGCHVPVLFDSFLFAILRQLASAARRE